MFLIDLEKGLNILYGGWFLGGGGGGSIGGGRNVLDAVLAGGGIRVCSIDEIDPGASVLTGSLVGSPSRGGAGVTTDQCRRAYELYARYTGAKVGAFIANEAGAHSITNGWIAALATGLPVVDAACNGRAHPTGVMGAMGLDRISDHKTVQIAVGGEGSEYVELCESGSIGATSRLVRDASVLCGGFITVLRNPVSAAYAKENAAVGAVSMCERIGRAIREKEGSGVAVAEALSGACGAAVLAEGTVTGCALESVRGFDVGRVTIGTDAEITFWNEYMTAETHGDRKATFPDLIMLLDRKSGLPICSAAVREGMEVLLITVPKEKLLLGRAMFQPELFLPCEEAIGKPVLAYAFPGHA